MDIDRSIIGYNELFSIFILYHVIAAILKDDIYAYIIIVFMYTDVFKRYIIRQFQNGSLYRPKITATLEVYVKKT